MWVLNGEGAVLLAQRKWNKKNDPGKWGPGASGTVEPNETYDETMIREMAEELGADGSALRKREKLFVKRGSHGHTFFCQLYDIVIDWPIERFTIQTSEVETIRWFTVDEIRCMLADDPMQFTQNFAGAFETMASTLSPKPD